jgi:hypothetical protein
MGVEWRPSLGGSPDGLLTSTLRECSRRGCSVGKRFAIANRDVVTVIQFHRLKRASNVHYRRILLKNSGKARTQNIVCSQSGFSYLRHEGIAERATNLTQAARRAVVMASGGVPPFSK